MHNPEWQSQDEERPTFEVGTNLKTSAAQRFRPESEDQLTLTCTSPQGPYATHNRHGAVWAGQCACPGPT
jgi:hypothetical protein